MRALAALIWKDLIVEARTRELTASMSLVAFLSLVIMSLALGPDSRLTAVAAPGILWVTVSFAGALGLARAHALDQERQALEGVLQTPVSRSLVYLGKFGSNLIFVLLLQAVVAVAWTLLFSPDLGARGWWLIAPLSMGAVGFTALGTLFGAMTAATRLREVLLPILLLPATLPAIILSLAGLAAILEARPMADLFRALRMLGAVDVVFVVLGIWLFEYVAEE